MKKILAIILSFVIPFALSGCMKSEETMKEERARAVKVIQVEETENPVTLDYIGTVDSKDIVNYSFKSGGKIGKIYVDEGDTVKKGDKLAELDMQDIRFQVNAAKANLDAASLNIKKAKDSYDYQNELFSKIEKLFKEGSISKDYFDQAKLQTDVAYSSYNQAKSKYDAAKTDYDYKKTILDEAVIYAEQDGSIVKVPFDENERVAAGNPVVVFRSKHQIINVGIAQKDLKKIEVGTKADIDIDGETASGYIESIAEAPDSATRTYNAEVKVEGKTYRLGSIGKVSFNIGNENGIWIPMNVIFSNGVDYVYVVKEDRAFKRTIDIQKNHEDKMLVEGVKEGEYLAVSGMKNISDGSKINVVE